MRQNNDTMIAGGVSVFAIGLAFFNLFFPWPVSAVIFGLGVAIGYGVIRVALED